MRRPSDDLLAAAIIVIFVLVLAGVLWILWLVLAPVPAASEPIHRAQATRSEGRPPMSAREYVALASISQGWSEREWRCLVALITVENHEWSATIKNPTSSASGLFQMMRSPSGRMFNEYRIVDQARIGTAYIADRYGTACRALAHERRVGWY